MFQFSGRCGRYYGLLTSLQSANTVISLVYHYIRHAFSDGWQDNAVSVLRMQYYPSV